MTAAIYVNPVKVLRVGAKPVEPFPIAVIAAAAPGQPSERTMDQYVQAMAAKIRCVLRIACFYQHKALVLGAWGCGNKHNPPRKVAELFKDELFRSELAHRFERVVFAIKDADHLAVFREVFQDVIGQ